MNSNQDETSCAPTYEADRKLSTFNYPETGFKFTYPITFDEEATTVEIEKDKIYEIKISGGDILKIFVINKDQNFVRLATNPNKVEYRKFISDDKLAYIMFYGYGTENKVVEIILDVANQMTYSDTIISSFEFTKKSINGLNTK